MHVLGTWLYPLRPQLSAQAPSYSNCSMNIWMIDGVNKIFRLVYQINLPHFLSCEYYGFWLILCNLFFLFGLQKSTFFSSCLLQRSSNLLEMSFLFTLLSLNGLLLQSDMSGKAQEM